MAMSLKASVEFIAGRITLSPQAGPIPVPQMTPIALLHQSPFI
jgi:hypothetical protein